VIFLRALGAAIQRRSAGHLAAERRGAADVDPLRAEVAGAAVDEGGCGGTSAPYVRSASWHALCSNLPIQPGRSTMQSISSSASRPSLRAIAITALIGATFTPLVHAADWSDTSLGVRYGTKFAEPFDTNPDGSRVDIKKTIVSLTHADGYKYGTNFFNADILLSNGADPGGGVPGNAGAQEVYVVYRNTLDIGKISGTEIKFGPVRGAGFTLGFDLNSKNDFYASKKRMLVLGPTLMFDVPGFANLSALVFHESNAPENIPRYSYKNHGALELDWGIPIGALPLSFNGYALYIGAKGANEFGGGTSPETHIDATFMWDVGMTAGGPKHTFLLGVEYEYWRNKFGNPTEFPGAGQGATARTPMVRAEYHF
jgi:nucleoside-specific outer membrane channel protein Tsx